METFGGDAVSLRTGLSVYHNSYKGVGYTIDNTLSFAKSAAGGMTGGISLSLSLDSNEGISIEPSLSLAGKVGEIGLGAGYNSRSGLSNVSFFQSYNYSLTGQGKRNLEGNRKDKSIATSFQTSSMLSLAHPGYTPQISMPMSNDGLSAEFRPGGVWMGIFGHGFLRGFYNEQRLQADNEAVSAEAYGYMNYQHGGATSLLDFNREKDGTVSKETPNLGIPSLAYDIYSVAGQGISAMYRPMRNDIGIIHDKETASVSNAGAIGIDLGPTATHVGVNLSLNHSKATSGPWTQSNLAAKQVDFENSNPGDPFEPWYFKVHGEPNVEAIDRLTGMGGEKAVRVSIAGDGAGSSIEAKSIAPRALSNIFRERKRRNQVIQAVTNEQLMNGTTEVLPYFKIRYFEHTDLPTGPDREFVRPANLQSHVAGITALTPEGLRYNYALPAYNKKQEEVTFSANSATAGNSKASIGVEAVTGDPQFKHGSVETDEFLRSISVPEYAHSHLLTSILGPDYVDVEGDGVTSGDLGYWVKFTYKRATTATQHYKWRDPFSKAHHDRGWLSDPKDDKGSFMYGEKELWYLAKVETKSHIAVFFTETRADGKGVQLKLQNNDLTSTDVGGSVHRLREIHLYSRSLPTVPIKKVFFDHDYSLCQGLYGVAGQGKLTLKKLRFEYGESTRGSLNPYIFTYSSANPNYNTHDVDRWGNYKPNNSQQADNTDFPYSVQDQARISEINANASAWSLTQIRLPSGGQVIVDYESDDYAYVQHRPAMQMIEIESPDVFGALQYTLNDGTFKVRFKLEKAIPASTILDNDPSARDAEVRKYLDLERKQVYFKLKIKLKKASDPFEEYISGYADIADDPTMFDLEKATTGGAYTHGYFTLIGEAGKHPFSMRAWQHLRTNQPDLIYESKLSATSSTNDRVQKIRSLGGIISDIRAMFSGFYTYCSNRNWGREVKIGQSWVRLKSPDKIKYGGGLRVRQITMKDSWSEDEEGTYGQIYQYTTVEDNQTISSGVASYEPIVGADENALRYAKKYVQSVPLRSDNNLFFEYPVNETYFPGPQIGYSKVTVWSLAAAALSDQNITVRNITLSNNRELFPDGATYGTTGKTEYEFFTAHDFPVISDETEKHNQANRMTVPVPFLGTIATSKLTSSQGYSIVTNDMHGRSKKVSNYRQQKDGQVENDPISWVRYNYLSAPMIYEKEKVNVLHNTFKDSNDNTLVVANPAEAGNLYTLGQETEFFLDMRQYVDEAWGGGARINTDIIYIPIAFVIPVPTVWPSVNKSHNQLRTAVTNKVIFKAGILESTEAYDGGSTMITRNIKWDKLTGVPIVTVTNNNFDDKVFSYTTLAHKQYEGMGAAYQNIGLTFELTSVVADPNNPRIYDFFTSLPANTLRAGDELILYEVSPEGDRPVGMAVYMGSSDGDNILHSTFNLTGAEYRAMVTRSGYRNQLSVAAGSITALEDPSLPYDPITHPKTITIIK